VAGLPVTNLVTGYAVWLVGIEVKRKRFTEEQTVGDLNEADQTGTIPDVCQLNSISEQRFYRWRATFDAMDVPEAKRLTELERENSASIE
jgi:putative transposase